MTPSLESLHHLSSDHRAAVSAAVVCGCFFCLHQFSPTEIHKYTDGGQTALCPHCGVDAVLPASRTLPPGDRFAEALQRERSRAFLTVVAPQG